MEIRTNKVIKKTILWIIGFCVIFTSACAVEEKMSHNHPASSHAQQGFFKPPPNVFVEDFQPKIAPLENSKETQPSHMHNSHDRGGKNG